jgi:hypothetical protein
MEEDDRLNKAKEDEEEEEEEEGGDQVGSSLTLERVAAAKIFIENHYKAQMKHIQQRKERFHFSLNNFLGGSIPFRIFFSFSILMMF